MDNAWIAFSSKPWSGSYITKTLKAKRIEIRSSSQKSRTKKVLQHSYVYFTASRPLSI